VPPFISWGLGMVLCNFPVMVILTIVVVVVVAAFIIYNLLIGETL
jgi:hypothetical protein